MEQLVAHTGSWAGTNGFRLMPDDALQDAAMRAQLTPAAKGTLTQLAYTWVHPEDGDQEGLLVIGAGEGPGEAVGLWADSWHQSPEPRVLLGTISDGALRVGYDYAGDWRWTVLVDVTAPDALVITMTNQIPESAATGSMAAGSYAAMSASLERR